MSQLYSSVSPKGQVTIPLAIRRMLKLKAKDRVEFRVVADQVIITPARSLLSAHFQSIPPLASPMSDEDAVRLAVEEYAEEAAREAL